MFYIPLVLRPLFSLCVISGNIQLKDPCTQRDFQEMTDQFQRYYQSLMVAFAFFSCLVEGFFSLFILDFFSAQ